MLTIIDHTEERWAYRYKKHGRENGASTYSKEIAEHHLPLWQEAVGKLNVTLSTCPKMVNMPDLTGDLAVQYLHTYSYQNGLNDIRVIDKELAQRFKRRLYITAYKSLHDRAQVAGFNVWHLPMSIDTSRVQPILSRPDEHYGIRHAAYYGNVLGGKVSPFMALRDEFHQHGWALTQVRGPQIDCWHELTKFDYGVGVGRCALEMMYLGLKLMVSGAGFGGIITNQAEFDLQRDTNFNGRITTFDREIPACLEAWDLSVTGQTVDVSYATSRLSEYLATLCA